MRPKEFKFRTTLLLLLLFSASVVVGQSYSKEKKIEKAYLLSEETEVEISNKYGDITIESWDKDSIKIVIEYKVTSTKEVKLNKTFDAIGFDFKANDYYIVAATEFTGGGSFWSDVSDIASNLFTGGTNTSIDYKIYAPKNTPFNLNLKYGNVYIANHNGDIKLSLSNGDLKAHNLGGYAEMEIVFGDIAINNIVDGAIKLNYGTFNVENADKLIISGQSSEYRISKVGNLIIDSKRDKIFVDEADIISGNTYFSRLEIEELAQNIDMITKYGNLKMESILPGVKQVKLISTNTTVNLYLQNNSSYKIKLTSDDKADITYSAELGVFNTEEISGKEKLMKASCLYGNMKLATPINVDIKSGFLSIKFQK